MWNKVVDKQVVPYNIGKRDGKWYVFSGVIYQSVRHSAFKTKKEAMEYIEPLITLDKLMVKENR